MSWFPWRCPPRDGSQHIKGPTPSTRHNKRRAVRGRVPFFCIRMAYPSYHRRPLAIIQGIKTFLALDFALRTSVRLCILTALVSISGMQTRNSSSKSAIRGVTPEDCVLVGWLLTSTALFIPGFIFADIAFCGWIAYGIRFLDINTTLHWIAHERTIMNGQLGQVAIGLVFFVEFLSMLVIGFARVVGIILAVCETYYDEGESSFFHRLLGLLFGARYDWWSFKSLPNELLCKPWYRRVLRPIKSSLFHSTSDVRSLASILFGANTFRCRRGEYLWFAILRGMVALFFFGFVAFYGGKVIILQPLVEHVQVPIQLQRVPSLPVSGQTPVWGVVLAINTRLVPLAAEIELFRAVYVTAGLRTMPIDASLQCVAAAVKPYNPIPDRWDEYRFLEYDCPTARLEGLSAITPQILISVDYTFLKVTQDSFVPEGSVKVWPRLTRDINDVLMSTNPTSMIIGNRMIASARSAIWSVFKTPASVTFGLDSAQRTFIAGSLSILGADFGPQIAANADTSSTLRIFQELQSTEWEMYTHVRNHSVLSGVSALGGISVFLNSLFAILFGGGIMMVLFDAKPLNIFGLLHRLSQTTLERQLRSDFPFLCTEGNQPGDKNAGTVAFLREYMLNLPVTPAKDIPECERTLTGLHGTHDSDEPRPSGDDDDDDRTRTDHTTNSRVDDNTVSTKSQWNSISIHPIALPARARPPRNLLERFWPFAKQRPKDFSRRDLEVASWSRKPNMRDHGRYYSQSTAASSRGFADDDWDRRAWYSSFSSGQ